MDYAQHSITTPSDSCKVHVAESSTIDVSVFPRTLSDMTTEATPIGERIKQLRIAYAMDNDMPRFSQGKLAAALGVDRNTVTGWEGGSRWKDSCCAGQSDGSAWSGGARSALRSLRSRWSCSPLLPRVAPSTNRSVPPRQTPRASSAGQSRHTTLTIHSRLAARSP